MVIIHREDIGVMHFCALNDRNVRSEAISYGRKCSRFKDKSAETVIGFNSPRSPRCNKTESIKKDLENLNNIFNKVDDMYMY